MCSKYRLNFSVESIIIFHGALLTSEELIGRINCVKNELKHNDSGKNKWVETDFEHEASVLFCKAVKNYFEAYNEIPKDRIVCRLFYNLTL